MSTYSKKISTWNVKNLFLHVTVHKQIIFVHMNRLKISGVWLMYWNSDSMTLWLISRETAARVCRTVLLIWSWFQFSFSVTWTSLSYTNQIFLWFWFGRTSSAGSSFRVRILLLLLLHMQDTQKLKAVTCRNVRFIIWILMCWKYIYGKKWYR